MTYLCAAIFVIDPEQAAREMAVAAEAGADMIELRIDKFEIDENSLGDLLQTVVVEQSLQSLIESTKLPCIVTCRASWEGGHSSMDDQQRIKLLENVSNAASYIDLELRTARAGNIFPNVPRERRPGLIFSVHDFKGRPEML